MRSSNSIPCFAPMALVIRPRALVAVAKYRAESRRTLLSLARAEPARYRQNRSHSLAEEDGSMTEGTQLIRGLEGVVAAETKLCDLDGANGRLAYAGYDIADLAKQATFEEVCYLLWKGELPTRGQYDELVISLVAARELPKPLVDALTLWPKTTDPNRPFQAAIAMLGAFDPDADDNSPAANHRKAVRLTAQLA